MVPRKEDFEDEFEKEVFMTVNLIRHDYKLFES